MLCIVSRTSTVLILYSFFTRNPCLLYFALLCFTLLYFALLCFTLLYFALLCFTLLYFALLCFTLLYFALLCFTLLYFALLCFTLLYFALLCFTLLYFDALTSARGPDQHQEVQLALLLPLVPLHPLLPEKHQAEPETERVPVQSGSVRFNQIIDRSDGSGVKIQAKLDLLHAPRLGPSLVLIALPHVQIGS